MGKSKFKSLKDRLRQGKIVKSLGVHDALSAVIAERAGFELAFLGGFGTAASTLGLPDLNLLTLTEMANATKRITARLQSPLIVDADTGHGGVHNIRRCVQEFQNSGAAGLIIEDQLSPKRCGHFQGKSVVSPEEMVLRLRAVRSAVQGKDFVVVARTDARGPLGLPDAIRRSALYRKAGADVLFIEAPKSLNELRLIPKKLKGPLLVNMLTGGDTPSVKAHELEKMGYSIVVYPIETLSVMAKGVKGLSRSVLSRGQVQFKKKDMVSFDEIKELLGLKKILQDVS